MVLRINLIPFKRPLNRFNLILLPRSLIARMNNKRERGSPFHMPLEGLKVSEGDPFGRIEKKVEEINF